MAFIFLTGHRGFIGSHLYPELLKHGHQVEVDLGRLHTKAYDYVIHLAAVTHTRTEFDPALYEANIILTKEIFKVPTRIIYASSCSAKYDTNPYAQSKMYAEHLAIQHGNAIALRFFNVYGPGNNKGLVKALMDTEDGADFTVRGPELVRDYVHVNDIVREIMFNIHPPSISYNMASIRDLISKGDYTADHLINDIANGPWLWTDKENGRITHRSVFVRELGTGIGTSTLSLVNRFMAISGKQFNITTVPANVQEPQTMVATQIHIFNPIDLDTGLSSMINHHEYKIH